MFNPFLENTYVVQSSDKNAYIFDPGCYEPYELNELNDYIQKEGLSVKAIINTHCHIDHVLGNKALKDMHEVPLMIPKNEKEIYDAVPAYAPQWGITNYQHADVDSFMQESDELSLDEIEFKLIEVPGHSPGHLMFHIGSEKVLIGGDVLFQGSIGRTDLPGGNHEALLKNIKEKVYILPDDTVVYPGHGSETTIGREKRSNLFVRA